jgi:hypothetical protein
MKSPWIAVAAVCHAFAFISPAILPSGAAEDRYALIYNGPVAADEAPEALADIAAAAGLPVRYIADLSGLPALLPRAAIFMIGGTEDDLSPLINAFTPTVVWRLCAARPGLALALLPWLCLRVAGQHAQPHVSVHPRHGLAVHEPRQLPLSVPRPGRLLAVVSARIPASAMVLQSAHRTMGTAVIRSHTHDSHAPVCIPTPHQVAFA